MKFVYLLISLISFSSLANELKLSPYIKMQESLAKDDFKTSLEHHQVICSKELLSFKNDYKDCTKKFKSIEELRASFKMLSEVYLKHGNKKEMGEFQRASCPMANGKWIQKKGELANPYYGKSMLTCGEAI